MEVAVSVDCCWTGSYATQSCSYSQLSTSQWRSVPLEINTPSVFIQRLTILCYLFENDNDSENKLHETMIFHETKISVPSILFQYR